MASKALLSSISVVAGADMTARQYYAVKLNSSGQAVLAGASDTTQIGIIQDKAPQGAVLNVAVAGVSKAVAGATVAAGVEVTSDSAGKIIAATTGKYIIGVAVTGAAANDVFSVLIQPRGLKA